MSSPTYDHWCVRLMKSPRRLPFQSRRPRFGIECSRAETPTSTHFEWPSRISSLVGCSELSIFQPYHLYTERAPLFCLHFTQKPKQVANRNTGDPDIHQSSSHWNHTRIEASTIAEQHSSGTTNGKRERRPASEDGPPTSFDQSKSTRQYRGDHLTDYSPVKVDERPSRVPGVDRCICLDEICRVARCFR